MFFADKHLDPPVFFDQAYPLKVVLLVFKDRDNTTFRITCRCYQRSAQLTVLVVQLCIQPALGQMRWCAGADTHQLR